MTEQPLHFETKSILISIVLVLVLSYYLLYNHNNSISQRCKSNSKTKTKCSNSNVNASKSKNNRSKRSTSKQPNSKTQTNKTNMRYAEKSRTATCSFADRAARIVLEKYKSSCPLHLQTSYQQTVLAGFLIEDLTQETLTCVALGVGTKYLSHSVIETDPESKRIRDSHAEILAKRSLQHYLYTQIEDTLSKSKSKSKSNPNTKQETIFTPHPLFPNVPIGEHPFVLLDTIRLHFYSSSVPCGNASIKRWAHPKRPPYHDLPPTKYPIISHPSFHIMQPEQGQVALLVKKEQGIGGTHEELLQTHHPHIIPVGTAPIHCGLGTTMTCSDKICIWNAVGVQGCLLSCLIKPMYMHTCTIGRKFSLKTCQRAMCCRISGFKSDDEMYFVHHPSMLQSSIKFDSSMVRDKAKTYFLEPRCFWWASKRSGSGDDSSSTSSSTGSDSSSGVIDGTTGLIASNSLSTDISSSCLLQRFQSIYSNEKMKSMYGSVELEALLNSSLNETKIVCNTMLMTTYNHAKRKLLDSYFKMQ